MSPTSPAEAPNERRMLERLKPRPNLQDLETRTEAFLKIPRGDLKPTSYGVRPFVGQSTP